MHGIATLATRLLAVVSAVVCMSCTAAPRHAAAQPPGFPDLSGFTPVPADNYMKFRQKDCATSTFRPHTTSNVGSKPASLYRYGNRKTSIALGTCRTEIPARSVKQPARVQDPHT